MEKEGGVFRKSVTEHVTDEESHRWRAVCSDDGKAGNGSRGERNQSRMKL